MSAERGWAAEWIGAILARERIEITPEAKEHILVGADFAGLRADRGAHPDGPVRPPAIERL